MPAVARWRALGTGAMVATQEARALSHAREVVAAELDAMDAACSRFRPDSELRRAAAAATWSPIGPLLAEALGAALDAASATDGDVSPAVGGAMRALGYDRTFAAIAPDGQSGAPVAAPGWQGIELDAAAARVRIAPGLDVDLGATAKALAADRAARAAAAACSSGVLVNLGGDVAVAGEPPPGGWVVRVTDDHAAAAAAPGQTISVAAGGLATSSTTVRRWRRGGRMVHHIVDPSTGLPARVVWRTVSVAAASCLDANVASTAAIVRGERAPAWLAALGLPARLVAADGVVTSVAGWPAEAADA
jgi:FAD:protein FMN transferase